MLEKVVLLLDSSWRRLLLCLLAVFKSTEFVRGFFRGTEAWFDQGVTMLLFFSACVLASRHDVATNKAARRVRISLFVLVALSLVWSTLRTTHSTVTNRMEHDRLAGVHEQMKEAEARRLGPVYEKYQRAARKLHCQAGAPPDQAGCAELDQRMKEIARFRREQPEQLENAQEFREALRARQERFRAILDQGPLTSKRLPEPVDFPIARKQYGYWETMQWMRGNPTRIEVQAVVGSLVSHGLVLTTAMLLAFILDLLKLRGTQPAPASAAAPESAVAAAHVEAAPPLAKPELTR